MAYRPTDRLTARGCPANNFQKNQGQRTGFTIPHRGKQARDSVQQAV